MKQQFAKVLIVFLLMTILPFHSAYAASSQEVMNTAKSYLGVPYRMGGTTPAGFDCSGYTSFVFRNAGVDLPRTAGSQYNVGTKVSKADLKPGDLVFFHKTYNKAGITHVGIYTGNNEFISATSSKGIKVDSLNSTYWGPKYYGATRVLEDKPEKLYDVSTSSPSYTAILTLSNSGIISGYPDGAFRPDANVTRAEAAAIINRVLKKQPTNLSAFGDVPESAWFAADVAAVKELGIIAGYPDGTFRPNNNMTRAEMAVILQKAFNLQVSSTQMGNRYNDITPSDWAYDAIVAISNMDQTSVFAGEHYNASDSATRAVFTTAIYNAIK